MPRIPGEVQIPDTERYRPFSLAEVVERFDGRLQSGNLENYCPAPLGFPQIDECLGGGLRAEDLALVGGMQNVGGDVIGRDKVTNTTSLRHGTKWTRESLDFLEEAAYDCLHLVRRLTVKRQGARGRNTAGVLRQ